MFLSKDKPLRLHILISCSKDEISKSFLVSASNNSLLPQQWIRVTKDKWIYSQVHFGDTRLVEEPTTVLFQVLKYTRRNNIFTIRYYSIYLNKSKYFCNAIHILIVLIDNPIQDGFWTDAVQ